jgi:hypothetical protein
MVMTNIHKSVIVKSIIETGMRRVGPRSKKSNMQQIRADFQKTQEDTRKMPIKY